MEKGKLKSYKSINIGGLYETNNFGVLEVLSINSSVKATIKFVATGYVAEVELGSIRTGQVKDWTFSAKGWVGKAFPTVSFGDVEVLEYKDAKNILVRFINTGFEGWYPAGNIKSGKIMDYIAPAMAGVGYIGAGKYSSGNQPKAYKHWAHMLKRCYTDADEFKNYLDKTTVEEWKCFQNFTEWATNQTGFDKNWQLDKDILFPENKIYGPDTCCFVPHRINSLIIKPSADGTEQDRFGTYYFRVRDVDSTRISKSFKVWQEGKDWYKNKREEIVKKVADQYKNELDSRVYEALYSWQVN